MSSFIDLFLRRSETLVESDQVPEAPRQTIQPWVPPLPPLPYIASQNATNWRAISRELLQGESLPIFVGPEAIKFTMPLAMMQYSCSKLAERVTFHTRKYRYILQLSDDDVDAWKHLAQFLNNGELDPSLGSRIPRNSNIEEITLLLCKMWLTADYLGMKPAQVKIVDSLGKIFKLARSRDMVTALAPETVIHVWESILSDKDLPDSYLWSLLILEMRSAFTSTKRPVFARYKKCFEISAFKLAIGGAMRDCIVSKLENDAAQPRSSELSNVLEESTDFEDARESMEL